MAAGETCSWSEYVRLWSKVTGKEARYRQVSVEETIEASPDREFGRELADMFLYSSEVGYDGGGKERGELMGWEDIEQVSGFLLLREGRLP